MTIKTYPFSNADPATAQHPITGTEYTSGGDTKVALDTSIVGGTLDVTQSGLSVAGRVTVVTVNNAGWTALPATPLVGRNAISVQSPLAAAGDVLINYVNGAGITFGMEVTPGGERSYDITDAIIIYGRAVGADVDLNVEELS